MFVFFKCSSVYSITFLESNYIDRSNERTKKRRRIDMEPYQETLMRLWEQGMQGFKTAPERDLLRQAVEETNLDKKIKVLRYVFLKWFCCLMDKCLIVTVFWASDTYETHEVMQRSCFRNNECDGRYVNAGHADVFIYQLCGHPLKQLCALRADQHFSTLDGLLGVKSL